MSIEVNSASASSSGEEESSASKQDYNVFRDTPVRYLGYANEVGESFRYQFPKFVAPSYVVAFGYCLMDATSNGYSTWNSHDPTKTERSREVSAALATGDTLLWQTFASVLIPGMCINMIVKASRLAVSSATSLPTVVAAWAPTAIGLGSVPLIIQPIDHAVDYLMDSTIRNWMSEESKEKRA
jgi:fission process protein 1